MSGFLERLIARHLDAASVRPRVASRFEDRAGAVVPDAPDPETAAAAPHTWGAPVQEPAVSPRASTFDTTGRAVEGLPPLAPPADSPGAVSGTDRQGRSLPDASGLMRRSGGAAAAGAPSVDDLSTATARPLTPTPSPIVPRDGPPAAGPGAVPAAAREPAGATRTPLERQPAARRSAAPARPVADVVHVHIGRVEVRAVMPPPERPRASRSKTPAALPLDRYLSGDGRR
jgi:hypothetical protein